MLAGQWYQIVVQYYNDRFGDSLKLEWSSPTIAREVIPCTQFTHSNQAPTVTTCPPPWAHTENQPLSIMDYVSVPVGNSSFEDPSGRAYDYQYGGSYGGWNFDDLTWSSSGRLAAAASHPTAAPTITPMRSTAIGRRFVQGTGQISQDVYFAAAAEYTINFLATYRNAYGGANPIDILIDGVKIATITPNAAYYQPYQTASFTVTAGTHTVTFKGETNDGTDRTSFIDNVSIQSVNGNPSARRRRRFDQQRAAYRHALGQPRQPQPKRHGRFDDVGRQRHGRLADDVPGHREFHQFGPKRSGIHAGRRFPRPGGPASHQQRHGRHWAARKPRSRRSTST